MNKCPVILNEGPSIPALSYLQTSQSPQGLSNNNFSFHLPLAPGNHRCSLYFHDFTILGLT